MLGRSLLIPPAICVFLTGAVGTARAIAAQAPVSGNPVDFNREIRPILSDKCFTCHGPDEKQRQAGLRLDTREGVFADRGGYQVIVAGDAARSRLFQRISHQRKAMRMPPPASGLELSGQQIELVRRWIEQGAKWEEHWAFVAPKRPPLPEVRARKWPRNPIDYFVLARLEREGLRPSPEADRATLLRRVSFDLTGLPPTPAEVRAFLADRSARAYEKQVDRLLASPRYGERMAMDWLDVARYADTHGYHIDSHRDMWPWRDWVIGAFNRNLPFDRFTIEQLAGDLLPGATTEQIVATGFNRNHMINYEGGAIPEEYLNEYVADRVETTSTAWLGLTMGCARCHDHKYDPIKQEEFYRLYAFFHNVPEEGLDGQRGNARPYLALPSADQRRRLSEINRLLCEKEEALAEAKLEALAEEWARSSAGLPPPGARAGIEAHYEFDGNLADSSGHYLHGKAVRGEVVYADGQMGKAAEFSGETHVELGGAPAVDTDRRFSVAVWVRSFGIQNAAAVRMAEDPVTRRGFEIALEDSEPIGDLKRGFHVAVRLIHRWPDSAIEIKTSERVAQGEWRHLAAVYDGSGKASGLRLFVDGKRRPVQVRADGLSGPIRTAKPVEVGNKALGVAFKGRLDDLRIYGRELGAEEIEVLAVHAPMRWLLAYGPAKRTEAQADQLRQYFLEHAAPEPFRRLHAEWKSLRNEREQLEKSIPTTMVMEELPTPRTTHVLGRGDYRNLRDEVTAGVPAVLPPLPKGQPANRLGLARWLVDPSNPLTARVAVNRYWQMYFGRGIVKTAENFGSQSDPPSHPELLDWLATEFIRSGWDVKAMQRLIVTSATYRQRSKVTPELLEKDPENRLLARGPRLRLPAEMIRDNALAVSGLLHEEIGGPGVFPYQPAGLWEEIAYGDVYTAQTYTPSKGKDLYRRSLYTFWKRTSPPPGLMTFDAPDREKCTARRPLTNTPLQALALLNDPTYVEAARALAQRMMKGATGAAARVRLGFRLATARPPTGEETRILVELARRRLAGYGADRSAAARLVSVGESKPDPALDAGELAAWTTVAGVILNMDETISKE